jgi:arylsulfatase A-like enzyme
MMAERARPNLILLVIDTLRADHLSCYGYRLPTSPNVDRMAREGVRFASAFSHASYTHPGYTSLLTGKDPITHQIVRMGGWVPLADHHVMLPEVLREAGYATAAVDNLATSGRRVKGTWFLRGFDTYINYRDQAPARDGINARDFENVRLLAAPLLEELARGRRPFFLFLHAWDTHRPLRPPEPYATRWYTGPHTPDAMQNYSTDPPLLELPNGDPVPDVDQADLRYTIALYDGAVSYVDAQLGLLLQQLDRLGLTGNTVLLFTADHGECLGEYGVVCRHKYVHDPTTHVPFIWWGPGILPSGVTVHALAQHMDYTPTVLDLAGIPQPAQQLPMDGISLVPVMRGITDTTYPYAFHGATNPDVRRAIRTHRYRFLRRLPQAPGKPWLADRELYDLATDPGETHNVVRLYPDIAERLEAALDRWIEEKVARNGQPDPLAEQAVPPADEPAP